MDTNWNDIWDKKTLNLDFDFLESNTKSVLSQLLKLNGFDSKTGTFSIDNYLNFIKDIFNKADLNNCDSVYEVGCGAGAFLYALNLQKICINMGGGG